jgi:hypothetical protein
MSEYSAADVPNFAPEERNPATAAVHRREVRWQITVPLILGGLVIVALAVWAGVTGRPAQATWADISLIWLIIPTCVFGLITLLLLGGLTYGLVRLIQKLPGWMLSLQGMVYNLGVLVRRLDDRIVAPILRVRGWLASLQTLRRKLRL